VYQAAGITHLGATPRTAAAERKAILVAVIGDRERVARYQSRADLLILEAGRAQLDGLILPRQRQAAGRSPGVGATRQLGIFRLVAPRCRVGGAVQPAEINRADAAITRADLDGSMRRFAVA